MTNKLAVNAFSLGLLIIISYVFVGIGGTALNLAIPIVAFCAAGFFFGRSYPKVFLQVALLLALPATLLMLAGIFKFGSFDKQFLIEGISALAAVTIASISGSYIGKITNKNIQKH